jgi:N-acetylglutamate synthase-like GNAT family acetyltransferase
MLADETVERRVEKLKGHLNRGALPIAWVAHEDGKVLGTAALRAHDLEGREDLTPWLAGVFVRPDYRRRGVASALCLAVEEGAWSLGFETLYLFTLDRHSLYARLGWRRLGSAVWRGHPSEIMVKDRAPPDPPRDSGPA